jgi:hypothetical protein
MISYLPFTIVVSEAENSYLPPSCQQHVKLPRLLDSNGKIDYYECLRE